ncbi:MAG: alpha/beta hydrolase [Flavobacterium sp.]|nr:alpha/beta hydrolase [Flavobacterium sp.]
MKKLILLLFLFLYCQAPAAIVLDSTFIKTTDQVALFVKTIGEGQPILFIHGGPGSSCLYFEKGTAGKLQSLGQWYFVDQRGSGRSESATTNNYSLDRVALDFEEVRIQLGIAKWTVVAHSFGGILATQYAVLYPNSIDRLVYLNATVSLPDSVNSLVNYMEEHFTDITAEDIQFMKDPQQKLTERFGKAFGILQSKDLLYQTQFESRKSFERDQQWMQSVKLNWDFAGKVFQHEEYLKSYASQTKSISCKVLVISGQKDRVIGADHHSFIEAPETTVHLSEGSHGLYMERTLELFSVLNSFFKQ